ncbi:MAG: type II toxin-antitoxin system RelB/DinJ family antitoxin [Oscillospiraceae bacterium]|nr:type II toxin-antitoxin system RelB/DinJ family antitoxin [Oscillospiraceae bacterium]
MGQTSINIRTDEELKKQFDEVCDEMGLTLSSAINIFMKTVVREREIPFRLTATKPSFMVDSMEELNAKLEESYARYAAGDKGRPAEEVFAELERIFENEGI